MIHLWAVFSLLQTRGCSPRGQPPSSSGRSCTSSRSVSMAAEEPPEKQVVIGAHTDVRSTSIQDVYIWSITLSCTSESGHCLTCARTQTGSARAQSWLLPNPRRSWGSICSLVSSMAISKVIHCKHLPQLCIFIRWIPQTPWKNKDIKERTISSFVLHPLTSSEKNTPKV